MQVARPTDPRLKELLKNFVCVRVVQTNGIDLSLFQFDYDLTFAAFLMNADRTIYGRYGTRSSQKDPDRDISVQGLIAALEGALELHDDYPKSKSALVAKSGKKSRYSTPESYPSLKTFSSRLDYDDQVARSCIHCHMLIDADRKLDRAAKRPLSDKSLFPWPMPDLLGLTLSPKARARIESVAPDSPARKAGFKAGDEIITLAGQPILSVADVQWVLHNAADRSRLKALVKRGDLQANLSLVLAAGWRRGADISWRTSSWGLSRMALGGMRLEPLSEGARQNKKIDKMALLVKSVGKYGEHRTAMGAGFKKGDIILSFDGREDLMTEGAAFAHGMQKSKMGEKITVKILRGNRRLQLKLLMK